MWIFASKEQRDRRLALLKCLPCPHCKHTGALNRHGFLKGYDELNFKQKAIRAIRVFCSDRANAGGCGRTFSVWIADKVKRLFLDTDSLWQFLEQAATTGSKSQAFRDLQSSLSDSAPYRIWKRFLQAQAAIRTALTAIGPPPKHVHQDGVPSPAQSAAQGTIAHLKAAFQDSSSNPIAAFQNATQRFFI
ncbi:hypothetical protein [Allorhodopirellula solitaria]|uniref:Uncharacterized protein n=1 Tax=Allorhodopirellula solitaria TaxID=2527987 RepID=A0A5C5X087_9BACT|nr:hypothetical protein [Allorhodopirellula solitaria]TWT55999.1 hypothetical protein CA85_47070 [Allorhodopirellula solitaria]